MSHCWWSFGRCLVLVLEWSLILDGLVLVLLVVVLFGSDRRIISLLLLGGHGEE